MRAAAVGHVEWIEFGQVDHVPAPGEIVQVSDSWQEPAWQRRGGGAALQARRSGHALHRARRRRGRTPGQARPAVAGSTGEGHLPPRPSAARLCPHRLRGRADHHSTRSLRLGLSSMRWWRARDPGGRYAHGYFDPPPRHVVRTEAANGGSYEIVAGTPPRCPVRCAISSAPETASLVASHMGWEPACRSPRPWFAARCGTACLTGSGPYQGQLREQG